MENEIFWRGIDGGWEKESVKVWLGLCKINSVILDIGANTGLFALTAKCINPSSNVVAFEPVQRVFNKLEKNVRLNEYGIKCIPKAVSDFDGIGTIYVPKSQHVYSVTVNLNMSTDAEVVETKIAVVKLATFLGEYKIDKIDLLKIDVETHEPEVLSGLEDILVDQQPNILLEVLSDENANRIQEIIRNCNYFIYDISESIGITRIDRVRKSSDYNILLCKPEIAKKLGLS